jgi:hypothetical protein
MRSRLMMLLVGLGAIACATAGPAATPGTQSQATDDSRRAELYPKVSKYLSDAVALEPAYLSPQLHYPTEGVLIGWRDKVCPRLTGLPRQDGVLVLTRVLAVARAAGVRMGDKHCSPNLYIFVTSQPEELVKGLEKQNSYEMFGPRGVPYLLDQFVDTPRPVRVWYNIYGRRGPMATFTRVIVIVNETRLQGVKPGQLADFIAMVGLAEIKPGADLGNAPSILKLFDGGPETAPAGMSDWDQAFLKSLYSNSRAIPWKRQLGTTDRLTLSMVSEIVH